MAAPIETARMGGRRFRRPLVLEVIGLPGSGKSTLAEALARRDGCVLPPRPRLRDAASIPPLAMGSPRLLPALVRLLPAARRNPVRADAKRLLSLAAWRQVVLQEIRRPLEAIILDQGPAYCLLEEYGCGPRGLRGPGLPGWWAGMFRGWASALDVLIWLDAPDAVLLRRIRARNKPHGLRRVPEPDALAWLADHRRGYERGVSLLTAGADAPELLRVDTALEPAGRVLQSVLGALSAPPPASPPGGHVRQEPASKLAGARL